MNWRLYRSITDGNYEIEEFRSAISSFDAHQRECQQLEETEDSQIPLVLEDIDSVFREMVRTPDYFTSSDSHDDIETKSEDNSIVALPCEILWQTFSSTWKIDDGHLKWWGICGRELDWQNF